MSDGKVDLERIAVLELVDEDEAIGLGHGPADIGCRFE